MCATLRIIWLSRNELTFQSKITEPGTLKLLTKIRSFKWIMEMDGIKSKLELLKRVNSIGAYLLYKKRAEESIFELEHKFCRLH